MKVTPNIILLLQRIWASLDCDRSDTHSRLPEDDDDEDDFDWGDDGDDEGNA